jgi:hypothetical protein
MKMRIIAYWVTTAVVALVIGFGGVMDLLRPPDAVAIMTHLGYPAYFLLIIGVWKVLGAAAILAPRLPLLKEWAYAGIVFDLIGAAASHAAVSDPAMNVIIPILGVGVTAASWALRPASRRLPATQLGASARAGSRTVDESAGAAA